MRRTVLVAAAATISFVLTGCSGGTDFDAITVTTSAAPKVKVEQDFSTDKTETRVIAKGEGEKVVLGDTVKINYIAVNGRTGKEFDNSFTNKTPMTLTLNEKTSLPGFKEGLVGQNIGSRVLVAVPSKDGAALLQSAETLGLKKDDTMVFVFDLLSVVPAQATGKALKSPSWLPTLTTDKDKRPVKFVATAKTDKNVDKTSATVLIKGTGDPVKAGQTVTAHYVGQKYPAGDVFDESWSTGPRPISLAKGAAIPCWTDKLVGQTIGSRVVLVCSSEDAYGKSAKAEGRPDGTLIFAVDILDAS